MGLGTLKYLNEILCCICIESIGHKIRLITYSKIQKFVENLFYFRRSSTLAAFTEYFFYRVKSEAINKHLTNDKDILM